jgi:hypothetical protein
MMWIMLQTKRRIKRPSHAKQAMDRQGDPMAQTYRILGAEMSPYARPRSRPILEAAGCLAGLRA